MLEQEETRAYLLDFCKIALYNIYMNCEGRIRFCDGTSGSKFDRVIITLTYRFAFICSLQQLPVLFTAALLRNKHFKLKYVEIVLSA